MPFRPLRKGVKGDTTPGASVVKNGTDALTPVQQVEGLVDLLEGHVVGDEAVDVDLALHVLLHVARQLRAPLHAAEAGALPDPAGDQPARTGGHPPAATGSPAEA